MRKVVYTYIFNQWDFLKPPVTVTPDWRYVCFTDENDPWLPGPAHVAWEVHRVGMEYGPKRQAGYYLTHGLDMFAEYDIIVSVTGQCHIIGNMDAWVAKFLKRDYALMHHPTRNCTYKEAAACARSGRDNENTINIHMNRYRAEGMPEATGMVQTGIIGRRNKAGVKEFERLWWEEIRKGSQRDQLSWNYVHWKYPHLMEVDHWNFAECQTKYIAVTPHYRKKQLGK